MAFRYYNANPKQNLVGDCVIRAISRVTGMDWDETYIRIALQGFTMRDMPSSNNVWGAFLYNEGFRQGVISHVCPDCYTVRDFCAEHPRGEYILATGSHVLAVEDGNYYDTWDSGDEIPVFFWERS